MKKESFVLLVINQLYPSSDYVMHKIMSERFTSLAYEGLYACPALVSRKIVSRIVYLASKLLLMMA